MFCEENELPYRVFVNNYCNIAVSNYVDITFKSANCVVYITRLIGVTFMQFK